MVFVYTYLACALGGLFWSLWKIKTNAAEKRARVEAIRALPHMAWMSDVMLAVCMGLCWPFIALSYIVPKAYARMVGEGD